MIERDEITIEDELQQTLMSSPDYQYEVEWLKSAARRIISLPDGTKEFFNALNDIEQHIKAVRELFSEIC